MDALYAGKNFDAFIKKIHLILASYLPLCLFLTLNIFIAVKEDLDNMDVINPPGIPVKTKRLPPNKKRLEIELALKNKCSKHLLGKTTIKEKD